MPCLLMDWCQSAQTLSDMAYSIFFKSYVDLCYVHSVGSVLSSVPQA